MESNLPDAADRAYVAVIRQLLVGQAATYLVAASEYRHRKAGPTTTSLAELARRKKLHEGLLAGFVDYLNTVASQPAVHRHPTLRDAAAGTLTGVKLAMAAEQLQHDLTALVARESRGPATATKEHALARAALIRLRADDPYLVADSDGRVILWPNRSGLPADARPVKQGTGPVKTSMIIHGHSRAVLRFDGEALLELPRKVPATGSLFVVFRTAGHGTPSQRLLGWEDADAGKHGLGLMLDPKGRLHAVLRNNGQSGDLVDAHPARSSSSSA